MLANHLAEIVLSNKLQITGTNFTFCLLQDYDKDKFLDEKEKMKDERVSLCALKTELD